MTMTVQQCLGRIERPQIELQLARLRLAREEFFEQHRLIRERADFVAWKQGEKLIAQSEQAGRLQSNDRHIALSVRFERVDHAFVRLDQLVRGVDVGTVELGGGEELARGDAGASFGQREVLLL